MTTNPLFPQRWIGRCHARLDGATAREKLQEQDEALGETKGVL